MAKARKGARSKRPARKPARNATSKGRGERAQLVSRISKALNISAAEAEIRALRELAERVSPTQKVEDRAHQVAEMVRAQTHKLEAQVDRAHQLAERAHVQAHDVRTRAETRASGALPEQLFLLLDGRGLDGRGMPVQIVDDPAVVGSGRACTVWVNSPRIETRHLQFVREGDDWYVEDLGSAHGTFLGEERVQRRRVEHGDEYRLAGYLRLRTEFR
ncbi:MAG TPA: FHA domain-containing protein [Myxococcales bacterium]|nr:FHA domain-containing protein [Myxococcales bacterium]